MVYFGFISSYIIHNMGDKSNGSETKVFAEKNASRTDVKLK